MNFCNKDSSSENLIGLENGRSSLLDNLRWQQRVSYNIYSQQSNGQSIQDVLNWSNYQHKSFGNTHWDQSEHVPSPQPSAWPLASHLRSNLSWQPTKKMLDVFSKWHLYERNTVTVLKLWLDRCLNQILINVNKC